jgi:hypothetical protein
MISIGSSRRHAPPVDHAPWSVVAAAGLTCALWGAVSLVLRQPSESPTRLTTATAMVEAIIFLVPHVPSSTPTLLPARTLHRTIGARASPQPDAGSVDVRENDSVPREPPTMRAPADEAVMPAPASTPGVASSRLAVPRQPGIPWYSPSRPRSPFAPEPPLARAEQDSIVSEIGPAVPELAARRVQPQSERDAAAKEAMLKMRLTGRILLVPPDNTGGLITSRIPLPLFSRGSSAARRKRNQAAFDANRARLERLRQRADSARRARGDTLPP